MTAKEYLKEICLCDEYERISFELVERYMEQYAILKQEQKPVEDSLEDIKKAFEAELQDFAIKTYGKSKFDLTAMELNVLDDYIRYKQQSQQEQKPVDIDLNTGEGVIEAIDIDKWKEVSTLPTEDQLKDPIHI